MSDWLELFNAYRVPAQHLTSLLLAAAIWRWGGSPERWLIGTFVATMVLPIYIHQWLGAGEAFEIGPYAPFATLLDIVAAAMFISIALNANRNYPLWMAGFQLVAVGAHLVRALVDNVSPLAVGLLVIGPAYCQLLVLIAGFVRHILRQRRFGQYREWRVTTPAAVGLSL
jgi:uncharacterized oligopeptide transporter (OPT) family protein